MDEEPLILRIDIVGAEDSLNIFKEIAQSVRSIQPPIDAAQDKTQRLSRNMQSAIGPAQRLAKAMTELRMAQANAASNPNALFDAQYRAIQAQNSYAKAQQVVNPTSGSGKSGSVNGLKLGDQLADMIGGDLLPELGDLTGLLGEFAGPLVVVTGAVSAFASAAKEAAQDLNSFRQGMITSGGTASETTQLKGISDLVGADAIAMSREFASRISGDGAAAGFARQAGIYDNGGAYSDLDKSKNLLKAIEFIRNAKDDATAQRFARVEGVEPLLKLRDVSEDVYQNFKRTQEMAASIRTPIDVHNAANLNAQMSRFNTEMDTLTQRIKEGAIPGITDLYAIGAGILHKINEEATQLGKWWNHLMGADEQPANQRQEAAQDRHTQAMQDHAAALQSGLHGGGNRARNAIPEGWGGANSRDWAPQARSLGGFG